VLFFIKHVRYSKNKKSIFIRHSLHQNVRIEDSGLYLFFIFYFHLFYFLDLGIGIVWCHTSVTYFSHKLQSHNHILQKDIEDSRMIILYHMLTVCSIYVL